MLPSIHWRVNYKDWLLEKLYYYQLFAYQAVTAKTSIIIKNHSHMSYILYLISITPWKYFIHLQTWVQPANLGDEILSKDLIYAKYSCPRSFLIIPFWMPPMYQLFSGIVPTCFWKKYPATYLFLSNIGQ